jgi:pentatricopeptide repeat protein
MTNHIISLLVANNKKNNTDDASSAILIDTKQTNVNGTTQPSNSSNGNNLPLLSLEHRNQLNMNHCFDILEAWMELSIMEGQRIPPRQYRRAQRHAGGEGGGAAAAAREGGLDSAHEARRLLFAIERAATTSNAGTSSTSSSKDSESDTGKQMPFMSFVAHELKPSFYNVVLQAYAVSGGKREAATSAQALLQHMIVQCRNYVRRQEQVQAAAAANVVDDGKQVRPPVEPIDKSFNIVINCWSKSEEKDAGFKAQDVIKLMKEWRNECLSRHSRHRDVQSSSSSSFSSFYHCYRGCQPNDITIVSAIDAWSRSRHPSAPEKAMELWNEGIQLRMEHQRVQQHQQGQGRLSVTKPLAGSGPTVLFNATICAWVWSGRGREGMIRAEEILRHMIHLHEMGAKNGDSNNNRGASNSKNSAWPLPDARTYNLVLSGWADCEKTLAGIRPGEGAERAEQVLQNLICLFRQTGGGSSHSAVKPNRHFFTSCIAAWARAARNGVSDAPKRAQQLLDTLTAMYQDSDCSDSDLVPDTEPANAVIDAWVRALHRPDSMAKAQQVVEQLRTFSKPDLITYNILLDGMGKRGMGKQAVELLEWLEKESSSPSPDDKNTDVGDANRRRLQRPDDTSYNSVLAALAIEDGDDSSIRVLAMLDRMDQLESLPGRSSIRPSVVSFTIALNSWDRKCSNNGKVTMNDVEQAKLLVDKMIHRFTQQGDKSCKPDVRFFTKLIRICANVNATSADEQKRALDIVLDAIKAVEEISRTPATTRLAPSSFSLYRRHMTVFYEVSLLALSRLCDANAAQKSHLMHTHFDTCSKVGYVSQKVVECMGGLGSDGGGEEHACNITVPVLRPEWSRNIPTHYRPRISTVEDQNVSSIIPS